MPSNGASIRFSSQVLFMPRRRGRRSQRRLARVYHQQIARVGDRNHLIAYKSMDQSRSGDEESHRVMETQQQPLLLDNHHALDPSERLQILPEDHPWKEELAQVLEMKQTRKFYWQSVEMKAGEHWNDPANLNRKRFEYEKFQCEGKISDLTRQIRQEEMKGYNHKNTGSTYVQQESLRRSSRTQPRPAFTNQRGYQAQHYRQKNISYTASRSKPYTNRPIKSKHYKEDRRKDHVYIQWCRETGVTIESAPNFGGSRMSWTHSPQSQMNMDDPLVASSSDCLTQYSSQKNSLNHPSDQLGQDTGASFLASLQSLGQSLPLRLFYAKFDAETGKDDLQSLSNRVRASASQVISPTLKSSAPMLLYENTKSAGQGPERLTEAATLLPFPEVSSSKPTGVESQHEEELKIWFSNFIPAGVETLDMINIDIMNENEDSDAGQSEYGTSATVTELPVLGTPPDWSEEDTFKERCRTFRKTHGLQQRAKLQLDADLNVPFSPCSPAAQLRLLLGNFRAYKTAIKNYFKPETQQQNSVKAISSWVPIDVWQECWRRKEGLKREEKAVQIQGMEEAWWVLSQSVCGQSPKKMKIEGERFEGTNVRSEEEGLYGD